MFFGRTWIERFCSLAFALVAVVLLGHVVVLAQDSHQALRHEVRLLGGAVVSLRILHCVNENRNEITEHNR